MGWMIQNKGQVLFRTSYQGTRMLDSNTGVWVT